jgi:phenylpropionate dioxygenase-like ring-hydroxylating dioxygenase large terminal subunit
MTDPAHTPRGPDLIPRDRYISEAFMRLEWDHMWTRTWLLAGRTADLREPGDFFTFEIGVESILVVRDAPGSIRAYYNVCQHRGTQLSTEHSGHVECVRCPYHGWEWHLDGRLKRITDASAFPKGTAASELSLRAVACSEWAGFVWIHMDPNAAPLMESLGTLAPALQPYLLDQHALVRDVTIEWDCNWKVCMDNSNETYHVQSIHPQLLDLLDDVNTRPEIHGDHSCFSVRIGAPSDRIGPTDEPPKELGRLMQKYGLSPDAFRGSISGVRPAIQRALREQLRQDGIDYPALSDDQLIDNCHVHIFPHAMLNIMLPGYWLFRVRPHATDPQRMYFDFQEYTRIARGRPVPPRPRHTRHRHGEISLDTVLDQDASIMPLVQRGLRSRGCPPLRLGAQESRLRHMHEVLERYIYGIAGAGR